MLKKLLLTAVLASFGVSAEAANILGANFNSGFTDFDPFVLGSNQPMANGSGTVAIGAFSITDAEIGTLFAGGDLGGLLAAFTQFATSTTVGGASAFDIPGLYKQDFSAPINAGNSLIGKSIYTLVGNAGAMAGSTQLLVLKSTATFDADNPVFAAEANLSDPTTTVLAGENIGGITVAGVPGTFAGYRLEVVPEPTALLSSIIGLFGLVVRRRRA